MNPVRIFLRAARILRTNNASHTRVAAVAAHYHSLKYIVTGALTQQKQQQHGICIRHYSNQTETDSAYLIDSVTYDRVCSETLDGLSDYFDELIENATDLPGTDVAYGDGVLTVNLGQAHGTYVINRQSPNKQIWLSSPTSGPKRFDFVPSSGTGTGGGKWIYKHSGESLHELLQLEIGKILKTQPVNFLQLPYCS